MVGSPEEKMSYEMESENAPSIFAQKESFVGVEDFDPLFSYFRIYTISPDGKIDKKFTICVRIKYKIYDDPYNPEEPYDPNDPNNPVDPDNPDDLDNSDDLDNPDNPGMNHRRHLQQSDDEFIEEIIPCRRESVDTSTNLNIALSMCFIESGKEIENVIIQKGNDLIGNFENGKNEIYEGKTFMNENDLKKVKQTATFTFVNPELNIKTNTIEGKTTEDRKNINFVLYHTENSNVQTIQATASFLKDSSTVTFTMTPSIDLTKGKTFIPNQMAQNADGEYLFFQNKVVLEDENEDNNSDDSNVNEEGNKKSKGLSKWALIGIIVGSIVILSSIVILIVCFIKKRIQKKNETPMTVQEVQNEQNVQSEENKATIYKN